MHKNVFMLPVRFTGSYTEDKPNCPRQNNLILQKTVSGVEFHDVLRLYEPCVLLSKFLLGAV